MAPALRLPTHLSSFYTIRLPPATTTMATITAEPNEKAPASPRYSTSSQPNRVSTDTISPGVARIEATVEHLTNANRVCIFFGVLLLAWAYGLDNTLRGTYQPLAVNALNAQSLLATVTVIRAVVGAAAQVSDICSSISHRVYGLGALERKLMHYSPRQLRLRMSLGGLKYFWLLCSSI